MEEVDRNTLVSPGQAMSELQVWSWPKMIKKKCWSTGMHMVEDNHIFSKCLNDFSVPSLTEDIPVESLFTHSLSIYCATIMCLVPGTVLGFREVATNKAKCLLSFEWAETNK